VHATAWRGENPHAQRRDHCDFGAVLGFAAGDAAGVTAGVVAGASAGASAGARTVVEAALENFFVPFVENEYSFFRMPAS
jgi:3-oxoacyl-ACP reductase-like protein